MPSPVNVLAEISIRTNSLPCNEDEPVQSPKINQGDEEKGEIPHSCENFLHLKKLGARANLQQLPIPQNKVTLN